MGFNATGTTAMAAWLLKRQFGKLLQGSFLGAPVLRATLGATEAKKSIFEVEYPGYFGVRLPSGGLGQIINGPRSRKKHLHAGRI